jgi:hypothetical protein
MRAHRKEAMNLSLILAGAFLICLFGTIGKLAFDEWIEARRTRNEARKDQR